MQNILINAEIVVAVSENNVIGKDNKLLWHIKEDLKLFKELTDGNYIVMGRKTFDSLPCLLPNRHHIVLTNNKNFKSDNNRLTVFYDLNELIDFIKSKNDKFFIIGGGEIYKIFYPLVNTLNISRVHKTVEGDTFFSKIDDSWELNYEHNYDEFTFFKYKKAKN